MGRKIMRKFEKKFEKDFEWGFKDKNGSQISLNRIKVVAFDNHGFMIEVRDYIEDYVEDIASYVGNLDDAVNLRNTLDQVIEILQKE